LLAFSQELFDDTTGTDPGGETGINRAMAERYPNIGELMASVIQDPASVIGGGCDDRVEFEIALDLMLDEFDGSELKPASGDPRTDRAHGRSPDPEDLVGLSPGGG
jgi:hypothetical protein